jgi:hypothetical protein
MAVRTIRVVARASMIPIADDPRGENQQDDERQRNPKQANCFPQWHIGGLKLRDNRVEC